MRCAPPTQKGSFVRHARRGHRRPVLYGYCFKTPWREHMISVDQEYTINDHALRNRDVYALAKYSLTTRWLASLLKPGNTAFNIGCGGGYYNSVLHSYGLNVAACEPDPEAFALAHATADSGTTVLQGDLLAFAASQKTRADLIVMHDVLEHIENDA